MAALLRIGPLGGRPVAGILRKNFPAAEAIARDFAVV
jgi:hypothetical protein